MKKVALTGGIGSGKSIIGSILREKGFKVIDADSIVSELYGREGVKESILSLFDSLDRREIARQAFSDAEKREKLEALLHPLARNAILEKLAEWKSERVVFVEVPLLFEAGFEKDFDFVVCVSAERETRIERLVGKGFLREECLQRMDAQLSEEERLKKAHFVIDNSGTIEETKQQIEGLLKELGASDG